MQTLALTLLFDDSIEEEFKKTYKIDIYSVLLALKSYEFGTREYKEIKRLMKEKEFNYKLKFN